MSTWSIRIYRGEPPELAATLTPDSPVDRIAWQRRGDGDCGEASIDGAGLDLRSRDIVVIQALESATSPDNPTSRWIGTVVESPGRAPGIATTRLAGAGLRLRETINTLDVLDAGDVSALAIAATRDLALPAPLRGWTFGSGEFPTLTLSLGERLPRLETLADTLEALAATAPGFTVAAGSYLYDGVTYEVGDVVPPVTWGARPDGSEGAGVPEARVFFRRATGQLALDERTDQLLIDWQPLSSEGAIDTVHFLLASAPPAEALVRGDTDAPVERFLNERYEYHEPGAILHSALVAPVDLSLALRVATLLTAVSAGVINRPNMFDGDPATYAYDDGIGSGGSITLTAPPTVRGWRMVYSVLDDQVVNGLKGLGVRMWYAEIAPPGRAFVDLAPPNTQGEQREITLLCPLPSTTRQPIPEVKIEIFLTQVTAPDTIRIYTFEALEPDTAMLDRIGAATVQLPAEESAVVLVPNRIIEPLPRLSLTLADGEILTGAAEVYDYQIARDTGLSTSIRLNQALSARDASHRAALDRHTRTLLRRHTRGAT